MCAQRAAELKAKEMLQRLAVQVAGGDVAGTFRLQPSGVPSKSASVARGLEDVMLLGGPAFACGRSELPFWVQGVTKQGGQVPDRRLKFRSPVNRIPSSQGLFKGCLLVPTGSLDISRHSKAFGVLE